MKDADPSERAKALRAIDWEEQSRRLLKSELARSGVSYKVLAARLQAMGIPDNEAAIASRVSRGKFTLTFFLQCMTAVEVEQVSLRMR
jgi:hypothetical protein